MASNVWPYDAELWKELAVRIAAYLGERLGDRAAPEIVEELTAESMRRLLRSPTVAGAGRELVVRGAIYVAERLLRERGFG